MKTTIRLGAFETNSSSTHAFAYLDPQAYSEFKEGGRWMVLSQARYDEWDREFQELDEDAPTVKRFGQEYADFSEKLYDEKQLDEVLDDMAYVSGQDRETAKECFLAISYNDIDGTGATQEWMDGIYEHGYYRVTDMLVSEDTRGGMTLAAEFHD